MVRHSVSERGLDSCLRKYGSQSDVGIQYISRSTIEAFGFAFGENHSWKEENRS